MKESGGRHESYVDSYSELSSDADFQLNSNKNGN